MKSATQYLCVSALLLLTVVSCASGHILDSLHINELYTPTSPDDSVITLPLGDSEYAVWHFDNPISFFSEKYDQLYVSKDTHKLLIHPIIMIN